MLAPPVPPAPLMPALPLPPVPPFPPAPPLPLLPPLPALALEPPLPPLPAAALPPVPPSDPASPLELSSSPQAAAARQSVIKQIVSLIGLIIAFQRIERRARSEGRTRRRNPRVTCEPPQWFTRSEARAIRAQGHRLLPCRRAPCHVPRAGVCDEIHAR